MGNMSNISNLQKQLSFINSIVCYELFRLSSSQTLLTYESSGCDLVQVMQNLKDLCKEGHTVISSIHQPRSSIFAMFDDLILLSEGRMLYSGPADQALPYFEDMGHKCPQHYNPAEFLADLISVDSSTPEAQHKTRQAFSKAFCTSKL